MPTKAIYSEKLSLIYACNVNIVIINRMKVTKNRFVWGLLYFPSNYLIQYWSLFLRQKTLLIPVQYLKKHHVAIR